MKNFIIKRTESTPSIEMNAQKGIIRIIGKSYPENSFEFYEEFISWIKKYFNRNNLPKTTLYFEITYENSSSSMVYFNLFEYLNELAGKGIALEINWIYDTDNDTALEKGEDYNDDFENLDFLFIEKF